MTEPVAKVVLCAVRTAAALILLAMLIVGARYLQLDYDDARALLVLFNGYFPELVALALFGTMGFIFYRASSDPGTKFRFINFFLSGRPEDVGKLVFFLFAMAILWSYFALYWREKLTTEYVVGTGFLFIIQGVAAISGKAWGKDRPREDEPKHDA